MLLATFLGAPVFAGGAKTACGPSLVLRQGSHPLAEKLPWVGRPWSGGTVAPGQPGAETFRLRFALPVAFNRPRTNSAARRNPAMPTSLPTPMLMLPPCVSSTGREGQPSHPVSPRKPVIWRHPRNS